MVAMEFIDQAERDRLAARPVELVGDEQRGSQRSYALEAARREFERILDDSDIRLTGLQVHTTLDAEWQERLETELTRAVTSLESERSWSHPAPSGHTRGEDPAYLQYAAVTLETRTGA